MTIALGKLTTVDPRTAWPHEAANFTPWLAEEENLQSLGDELGLELEFIGREVAVGPYSADILAKDSLNGRNVVIENQLEKTNHDHLGKALTYGAILDASVVVWIAKEFTDEHRKVLDWLNDHTNENLEFFGVCVELWKVGDSLPAPRFNVVSRPAELVKRVRGGGGTEELTGAKKLQLEFWTVVRDRLKETKAVPSLQTPRPQYWFNVALGRSAVFLSAIADTGSNRIGVRLYLRRQVADGVLQHLAQEKETIEKEIGSDLEWNPNPEKQDKTITLDRQADLEQRDNWPEYVDWMTKTILDFRKTFQHRVKDLDFNDLGEAAEEIE